MTDTALLRLAADRAGRRPGFLGYDLSGYRVLAGEDPARALEITAAQLDRLALCRSPRRGAQFGDDVLAIARHIGLAPAALAALIRQAEVLRELQVANTESMGQAPLPGLLAAARSQTEEHTILSQSGTGSGLPGWLHDAVNRFWADVPVAPNYPRDLDFILLIGLPLAIVELPLLSLKAVGDWLVDHRVALNLGHGVRRIRACLVAIGGVGLVFVETNEDAMQRRVSLAHEAAHFVVEYLLPRQEVARRRPELLDVLDGRRVPTAQERLSAVLGDVPTGVHTHLLLDHYARGAPGADAAEWRARRVAIELLAPQNVVLQRMTEVAASDAAEATQLLVDEFGLPISLAADYAGQLVALVKPPPLGLVELLHRKTNRGVAPSSRAGGLRPSGNASGSAHLYQKEEADAEEGGSRE